jgi:hypothetical protein
MHRCWNDIIKCQRRKHDAKNTKPKENMINEEEAGLELTIPRIETCSNDVTNTPRKVGSIQYVYHREKQY